VGKRLGTFAREPDIRGSGEYAGTGRSVSSGESGSREKPSSLGSLPRGGRTAQRVTPERITARIGGDSASVTTGAERVPPGQTAGAESTGGPRRQRPVGEAAEPGEQTACILRASRQLDWRPS